MRGMALAYGYLVFIELLHRSVPSLPCHPRGLEGRQERERERELASHAGGRRKMQEVEERTGGAAVWFWLACSGVALPWRPQRIAEDSYLSIA